MSRLEGMLEVTRWKYCGQEARQECLTASYRQTERGSGLPSPGHHSRQHSTPIPKRQAKDCHGFYPIVKEVNFPILCECIKVMHLIFTMMLLKLRSRWVRNFPSGTFLVAQWLRLHIPNAEGPGLIPGQGIRFHMSQLKIPHATGMTQHSQINK